MSNTLANNKPRLDLEQANQYLQGATAPAIVQWAMNHFGERLILTSSFGAQSALMLHLVTQVAPNIPVVFIDTGYLFPETYRFAQELTDRLKLNLKVYQPLITPARQEALYGKLWEDGPEGMDKYHQINKIEPMDRAIHELHVAAWLAGLRRQQTDLRSSLRPIELQDGLYKVHPILDWTTKDVHEYLKKHSLPYHPLYEKGYKSIGDVHLTRPITAGQDERSGRFGGLKQECGLHVPKSKEESESREGSGL